MTSSFRPLKFLRMNDIPKQPPELFDSDAGTHPNRRKFREKSNAAALAALARLDADFANALAALETVEIKEVH
jgi:hypothetical protein